MAISANIRVPQDALMEVGETFEHIEYNAFALEPIEFVDDNPHVLLPLSMTDPSGRGETHIALWATLADFRRLAQHLTAIVDEAEARALTPGV